MENKVFKHELDKIFTRLGSESSPRQLNLIIEQYKKLWNFFILGDSFYFVLNHHTVELELVSKEVENVLGYTSPEFDMQLLSGLLHPEDHSWFLTFGNYMAEFFAQLPLEKLMRYKMRHDLRYRKKNGDYARLLCQALIIEHDDDGRLLRSLDVFSDVTYLKQEGRPVLSFIGMNDEPSFIDVCSKNIYNTKEEEFTKREKQVLTLLIEGRLSKEISDVLSISKQTVDTHRKNMLHKKNLNNTSELIIKAVKFGWI
jgi:DNA-binding CsgD family transcriptional regulator